MSGYPIVKFLVTQGDRFALGIAFLPLVCAVLGFVFASLHWLVLPAGAMAASFRVREKLRRACAHHRRHASA